MNGVRVYCMSSCVFKKKYERVSNCVDYTVKCRSYSCSILKTLERYSSIFRSFSFTDWASTIHGDPFVPRTFPNFSASE